MLRKRVTIPALLVFLAVIMGILFHGGKGSRPEVEFLRIHPSGSPPGKVLPQFSEEQLTSNACLSLQTGGIGCLSIDELKGLLVRLVPSGLVRRQRIHGLVHALRLWGATVQFSEEDCLAGPTMLSILLETDKYSDFCPEAAPLLTETPFGIDVRTGARSEMAPHTDVFLSVMAESGIPLDTPILMPDRRASLAEVLQNSVAAFRLGQAELEWTTVALAGYLPPTTTWTTGSGGSYSFDDLASTLLSFKDGSRACCGTHVIYSLCYLVRVDESRSILSGTVRSRVLTRLENIARQLEKSQLEAGGWDSAWHLEVPPGRRATRHPLTTSDELLHATGHHLEWIALAPPSTRPGDECIRRGCRFAVIEASTLTDQEVDRYYGLLTHLSRALCLLHDVDPAELIQQAASRSTADSEHGSADRVQQRTVICRLPEPLDSQISNDSSR